MARPKKSLREKVQEQMPDFADSVDASSVDSLNERLANIAKAYEENETNMEDDLKLEQAKEEAKELGAAYRDARKVLKLQTKYIATVIKEKGGA